MNAPPLVCAIGDEGYRADFLGGLRVAPAGEGAGLPLSRRREGRGLSVLCRGTPGAGYHRARSPRPLDPGEEVVVMVFRPLA